MSPLPPRTPGKGSRPSFCPRCRRRHDGPWAPVFTLHRRPGGGAGRDVPAHRAPPPAISPPGMGVAAHAAPESSRPFGSHPQAASGFHLVSTSCDCTIPVLTAGGRLRNHLKSLLIGTIRPVGSVRGPGRRRTPNSFA